MGVDDRDISYALMTETPLVVAMVHGSGRAPEVQRRELRENIFLTSLPQAEEYTVPILCPVPERNVFGINNACLLLGGETADPVILLSDKEVGMTSETDRPLCINPAETI